MHRLQSHRLGWLTALPLVAIVLALTAGKMACAPAAMKEVKAPREGQALSGPTTGPATRPAVAVVYSKHYQINMGGAERLHSFDIRKYARIYLQLVQDGYLTPEDVFVPPELTDEQIRLVHSRAFMDGLKDSGKIARWLEVPIAGSAPAVLLDVGVLNAFRYASAGTIVAAREAVKCGIAINLGGGYHHATPDKGGGFCIYNDIAIAIHVAQNEGLARRVMVVDLDAHQGNGTALCFPPSPDRRPLASAPARNVFLFDMYQQGIYPLPKEREDVSIPLGEGIDDARYMAKLRERLPGAMDEFKPDLVIFQAGCDVLKNDGLAGLALTPAGLVERDQYVIEQCVRRRVPVAMVLGGGYGPNSWQAQCDSIRAILDKYAGGRRYQSRPPTIGEKLYTK